MIEMDEEQRAALLKLAAHRGEKGVSGLVQEALAEYLARAESRDEARRQAVALRGCFSERAAEALRAEVVSLRANWR